MFGLSRVELLIFGAVIALVLWAFSGKMGEHSQRVVPALLVLLKVGVFLVVLFVIVAPFFGYIALRRPSGMSSTVVQSQSNAYSHIDTLEASRRPPEVVLESTPSAKPPASDFAAAASGQALPPAASKSSTPRVSNRKTAPVHFREFTPPADTPDARPQWLDKPQGRQRDTYYTVVTVGPYNSPADCEDEFAIERDKAVKAYIANHLGPEAARGLRVEPSLVNETIVQEVYYEPVDSTVGNMVNMHALLAFDSRVRKQLEGMWRAEESHERLLMLGGGASAVLLVLAAVFGYLKFDTLTRGYYTRRLQIVAAALILTAVAVIALLGLMFVA